MRPLLAVLSLWVFACSSADDSALDASADAPSGEDSSVLQDSDVSPADAAAGDAAPAPTCDVILDASFPDAYYPSVSVPCSRAGDPCALPPAECVFDRYRVRYLKGYCSSSLSCVFTYSREECSGADPVGCEAGECTCGP